MRKKPNNKMIGIFIICGVALFFATIGIFVSNRLLQNSDRLVVMYFSESIKGLDVGSPVVFKGVSVGRVVKIDVITDFQKLDFIIPVYVAFNSKKIASRQHRESVHQILEEMVAKGLRARLGTQNYLTGQLMIELEFIPSDEKPVYRHPADGKIPEVLLYAVDDVVVGIGLVHRVEITLMVHRHVAQSEAAGHGQHGRVPFA